MLSTKAELKPLTEETIQNLLAVTTDPIDAMRLASDLYATNAYLAERALAIEAGKPQPRPPKPHSRYMRSLARDFTARLVDIAGKLTPAELSRLQALQGAIVQEIENSNTGLIATALLLAAMHPRDAASWIRAHFDELEAGLAS